MCVVPVIVVIVFLVLHLYYIVHSGCLSEAIVFVSGRLEVIGVLDDLIAIYI